MRIAIVLLASMAALRAQGIVDPPEFSVTTKQTSKEVTEIQKSFALSLGDSGISAAETLRGVSHFITEHPTYGDAYAFRVLTEYCEPGKTATDGMLSDIEKAIQFHDPKNSFASLATLYGAKARLEYDLGRFQATMDDIERGIRLAPSDATSILQIGSVKAETRAQTDQSCNWTQTEMDGLVRRFPKDYRALLYRGIYFSKLAVYEETLAPKAIEDFQKALAINPKSSLAHYFIGDVYTQSAFWGKASWASDEARDTARRRAANEYTIAIGLDPRFKEAYANRADSYLALKQHLAAIRDFDKVIELDPKDAGAYHDRALAREELGNVRGAIFDFDDAIRLGTLSDIGLPNAYENRGKAHMKVGMYREAVEDFSAIIALRFSIAASLMNIKQFRSLYPELNKLSEDTLIKNIHDRFTPQYSDYDKYSKQLKENAPYRFSLLSEAYENRMDAYIGANRFRRALADYNRAVLASDNEGRFIERWRSLGKIKDGERFVDVKTLDLTVPAKMWIKTTNAKGYSLESFEVDCRANKIRSASSLTYDENGKNTSSFGTGEWQSIVPDSLGERFYSSACSN